jgi:hypothetical protein
MPELKAVDEELKRRGFAVVWTEAEYKAGCEREGVPLRFREAEYKAKCEREGILPMFLKDEYKVTPLSVIPSPANLPSSPTRNPGTSSPAEIRRSPEERRQLRQLGEHDNPLERRSADMGIEEEIKKLGKEVQEAKAEVREAEDKMWELEDAQAARGKIEEANNAYLAKRHIYNVKLGELDRLKMMLHKLQLSRIEMRLRMSGRGEHDAPPFEKRGGETGWD